MTTWVGCSNHGPCRPHPPHSLISTAYASSHELYVLRFQLVPRADPSTGSPSPPRPPLTIMGSRVGVWSMAGGGPSLEDLLTENRDKARERVEEVGGYVDDDHHLECVFDAHGRSSASRSPWSSSCMATRQGQVRRPLIPFDSSVPLNRERHWRAFVFGGRPCLYHRSHREAGATTHLAQRSCWALCLTSNTPHSSTGEKQRAKR